MTLKENTEIISLMEKELKLKGVFCEDNKGLPWTYTKILHNFRKKSY